MGTLRTRLGLLGALTLLGCASRVDLELPVPYTAVEARLGDSTLQVRYLSREGLLYSEIERPEESRAETPLAERRLSVLVLTPRSTGREPPGGRLTGRRLPLLAADAYRVLRDAVIREAVPADGRSAIAVQIDGHEVSLFFDSGGRFHSVLGEPPSGFDVVERLPLEDFLSRAPGRLQRALEENGVGSRAALFNTGDEEEDGLPFLYVNLDTSTAAFVRVRPLRSTSSSAAASDGAGSIAPSLTHAVASNTWGVLNQPVSSVSRLIFMLSDAVQDSFDPVWTLGLESAAVLPLAHAPAMDLAAWEAEIDDMTGRVSSMGTISYLVDGEAFFSRLEEAVRNATESILLRIYIFDNDDYALRFADLLKERAADGVDVRVLMDGMGSLAAATAPPAGLPHDYEPPPSMDGYLGDDSCVSVRTAFNPFFASDHTKTIVIDEEIAFVGGMNIGREYRYEWHDMMAEVAGPVVAELADDFDTAWARAGFMGDVRVFFLSLRSGRTPGPAHGYPLRALYTRPTVSEIRNVQLAAIDRARRYIYLENAYFTDDAFLRALVRARRRGVDVRVVIPFQSDRGILGRDNILAANVMFRNGIRVYVYPGMSHVKAAVYDGWACLGSANVDQLSLRINREVDIASSDPRAVEPLLEALFEADFSVSPEMQEEFPTLWHDALWEMVGDYVF